MRLLDSLDLHISPKLLRNILTILLTKVKGNGQILQEGRVTSNQDNLCFPVKKAEKPTSKQKI